MKLIVVRNHPFEGQITFGTFDHVEHDDVQSTDFYLLDDGDIHTVADLLEMGCLIEWIEHEELLDLLKRRKVKR